VLVGCIAKKLSARLVGSAIKDRELAADALRQCSDNRHEQRPQTVADG